MLSKWILHHQISQNQGISQFFAMKNGIDKFRTDVFNAFFQTRFWALSRNFTAWHQP